MDKLVRAVDSSGKIRAFGAITTDLTEKARKIHNLTPVASAAMGRTMAANLMMGMTLKNETENISLQFKGDGPIGVVVTVADCTGTVRGYVGENNVDLPLKPNGKLDVGGAVGKGYLTVVKDLKMKEPYVGRTELVSGEIAEDLTYYFASSEQIPSIVALGVLVARDYSIMAAGGYIIQLMPDAGEEDIARLEANIGKLDSVTNMIKNGMTIEDMINTACDGYEMDYTMETTPDYKCNCDRTRIEKALISIGREEIEDIIKNEGKTAITCYFCNTEYEFSKEDLEEILENI